MRLFLVLLFVMLLPGRLIAAPDNARALAGLKTLGVIFDVNVGTPQKLLLRLKLIEETVVSIVGDGVAADVVVAFRGGATLFMTAGDKYLPADDLPFKAQIQAQAKYLKKTRLPPRTVCGGGAPAQDRSTGYHPRGAAGR